MTEGDIAEAYARLGYQSGWAFMMTPEAWLTRARTVMVGLNPGFVEASAPNHEGCWDHPSGNAYFTQKFGRDGKSDSPIQTQIKAIHDTLDLAEDDVFAAQFMPFRSRNIATLDKRAEAKAFSMLLWGWVVGQSPAKLYLCMGKEAAGSIGWLAHDQIPRPSILRAGVRRATGGACQMTVPSSCRCHIRAHTSSSLGRLKRSRSPALPCARQRERSTRSRQH